MWSLPAGAERRDAATVLPRDRMFFYKRDRTPAVFADLFRLELMRREAGIWADCDVLCVKPLAGLPEYVFGIEAESRVNNAVFRCPADSELLTRLLEVFEPGAVPPGMPWWRRAEVAVRRAFGAKLPAQEMQFGATGPWPLNHWVDAAWARAVRAAEAGVLSAGLRRREPAARSGLDAGCAGGDARGASLAQRADAGGASATCRMPQPGSFFARECERLGVR